MALTAEQEKRRQELAAKYGMSGGETQAPVVDKAARLEELRAKFNLQPPAQAPAPIEQPAAPAAPPPSVGQQALHVAKGVPQAGFDVLNLPNMVGGGLENATRWGAEKIYNLFADKPAKLEFEGRVNPILSTQDIPGGRALEQAIAAPEFEKGVAPWADAGRTAMEWGAGGIPNMFRKGGVKLAGAVPDLVAGLSAAGGDALVREKLGADSPWGEIVGGLAGAFATGRLPKKVKAEQRAVDFINENLADADKTVAAVRAKTAAGEKGTLADLGGDQELFDIEAGLRKYGLARNNLDAKVAERAAQIADEVQVPFRGGNVEDSRAAAADMTSRRAQAVRDSLRGEEAAIAAREAQATQELAQRAGQAQTAQEAAASQARLQAQRADEAAAPLATTRTPAEVSVAAQQQVKAMDDAFKIAEEQPKWRAFTEGPDVEVGDLFENANKFLKDLDPADRAALIQKYGDIITQPNAWKKTKTAAPGDVSGVFSRMRQTIEQNRAMSPSGAGDNSDRLMAKLMGEMQDSLATEMNPLYKEAKEATAELYDRFRSGPMGAARRAEPEQFLARAGGTANEGGAVLGRQAANAGPQMQASVVESLKAQARKSGGVTDDFIMQNEDAIRSLPEEVQQQFQQAAAANRAKEVSATAAKEQARLSQAAQKQVDREGQALKAATKSERQAAQTRARTLEKTRTKNIVSKYGQKPTATVKSLMSNPDNLDDLTLLTRYMDSTGNGAGLRAEIGDRLKDVLTPEKGGRVQEVSTGSIDAFNKMRDRLVKSKVLTPEQAADISEKLNKTLTIEQRKQAIARVMNREGSEYDNLVASGLAAGILTGMPGTQTLLVGGAVRRYIKRLIDSGRIANAPEVQALERLMLNPEEFLTAAKGAKTAEAAARSIITKAVGAGQVAAALDEEEQN